MLSASHVGLSSIVHMHMNDQQQHSFEEEEEVENAATAEGVPITRLHCDKDILLWHSLDTFLEIFHTEVFIAAEF